MDTMGTLRRTHYAATLTKGDIDKTVTVAGWVSRQRDLGGLIFVDLRDRTGILQLAFDQYTVEELFDKAFALRAEHVIIASGIIRLRSSINPDIPTGSIELEVKELKVLATSETPPFEIIDGVTAREDLRLKYRYLDLRRPTMQNTLLLRHEIVRQTRDFFYDNGFIEIETPILIKSTPEGARDYLVPSRVHPGNFYALPQSPQLYKQLSMLAGFDRYIQIARCFRDEDLRADRQPEFTQIDLEMSFVDQEDVIGLVQRYLAGLFDKVLGVKVSLPLPRMTYADAMRRYGSDKPDTRFEMELCELSAPAATCGFKVFEGAAVYALNVKGMAATFSRKEIDKLVEFAKENGLGGLAYTRLTADAESSSYEKFLTEEAKAAFRSALGAETGDLLLIGAHADIETVQVAMGNLRLMIAKQAGWMDKNKFNLLWVTDFPLFEYDAEEGRFSAKHHPFTHPADEDIQYLESDPGRCRAKAYDIILNGTEIGGGSIRINTPDLQSRMFAALNFTPEEAHAQFGYLLDAFRFGAPPHGGLAFGLDRLVMLMTGRDSIREVIAYPKVATASELMTDCPSPAKDKQLDELHIAVTSKGE